MDKKALLAKATEKLERQPASATPRIASLREDGAGPAETPETALPPKTRRGERKAEPVVSKGITLRPANVEKLDRLELSLRKQGIKAGHSGLIQIAIERLEDNAQLAASYRELLKQDLRLK